MSIVRKVLQKISSCSLHILLKYSSEWFRCLWHTIQFHCLYCFKWTWNLWQGQLCKHEDDSHDAGKEREVLAHGVDYCPVLTLPRYHHTHSRQHWQCPHHSVFHFLPFPIQQMLQQTENIHHFTSLAVCKYDSSWINITPSFILYRTACSISYTVK